MAARVARKAGRIFERSGKWWINVEVYREVRDGKTYRKRELRGPFTTQTAARKAFATFQHAKQNEAYVENSKVTVSGFFDAWFPGIRGNLRSSTADGYEKIFNRYVRTSPIGPRPIQAVRENEVARLYSDLLRCGGRDGRSLSRNSVRHVYIILHRLFGAAERQRLVKINVLRHVEPPQQETPAPDALGVWDNTQLATFVRGITDDRLAALWRLYVVTYCRRGEGVGIKWSDLDLIEGTWEVRRQVGVVNGSPTLGELKTKRSRRKVRFDAGTVEAFRVHKRRQAEEKLALGPDYDDRDLVFCHEDGTTLHPNVVTRWFNRHAKRLGLPKIRLHDIRHSGITADIRAGTPILVVSQRAGHASTAFTMDRYAHVLPDMQVESAERMGAILEGNA